MHVQESKVVRFLQGNEAESVEVINFNGGRFDVLIPNPEFMGKRGEAIRGSLGINKLTGMPVVFAPFTMNGVSGILVTDDQMTCYRALAEKGASSSILHEGIHAAGKLIPAYEGYDELTGGRFAGFGNATAMDTATYGSISYMRDNKLTVDNSMKYVYQEIMNINGDIAQQPISEESARALFKSGLNKADEALNILKGDGLRTSLRRSVAIETFLMFVYKSNPQAFNQAVATYQQTIRQNIANNQDKQTYTMLELEKAGKNGTELLTNMDALTKAVLEEAEFNKEVYFSTASGERPVNQIDEAFVFELLETLADPNKPSMSQAMLNAATFTPDAIQAGAKMIGRLNKLAKGSIKTYNDIVPFFPTMPRGESEEVVINKFAAWLSQSYGQDFSQLPFHYFGAKGNNGSFTDNKNGAFFGMGAAQQGAPSTLADAIGIGAGNNNGTQGTFGQGNNGALKGAFDSVLSKLGGATSQGAFGQGAVQGNFGGQPTGNFGGGTAGFGGSTGAGTFGTNNNQQSGYADSINNMLKGNNNQGGNNMWVVQGQGFGAVQNNNLQLITLNGVDYAMNVAETEATPHGVAARVYNSNGQLVGGALADGRCMDMSYNYVGTATLKQVQQQGFGQQAGGFGQQQAGFGGVSTGNGFGGQGNGFGNAGFGGQQQTGFGNAGFGQQAGGFGNAGFGQQQAGFGQGGLRPNPINNQGFGQRTMSII